MTQDWLKNLKADDYVFISSRRGKRLTRVQKITPTGRVVVDNIQFIGGANRSNKWDIMTWSGTDCTRNPYTEGCLDDKVNLKNEIKRLEKENRQLKTECALLDNELRIARQDTIDVLNKLKDYVNQLACDEYGDSACDTNYITIDIDKYEQDIDEMIEELTKCRR